jgi:hypothetical protein
MQPVGKYDGVLPVSTDFFQCPPLDGRMRKYLVRLANSTANRLIKDTLEVESGASQVHWKYISTSKGINIFKGQSIPASSRKSSKHNSKDQPQLSPSSSSPLFLRGVTEVNASIEEFAMLFKLDSTKRTHEHSMLFNSDLLSSKTLYTLVPPSGDHPRRYVGIKWCLVQSPSKLFRNRDFCFLEVSLKSLIFLDFYLFLWTEFKYWIISILFRLCSVRKNSMIMKGDVDGYEVCILSKRHVVRR